MILLPLLPLFALVPSVPQTALPDTSKREATRVDFAKAMRQIRVGMSSDEVLRILGKPGDVRRPFDGRPFRPRKVKEILCYGTTGKDTFPTLGQVDIDLNDKCVMLFGHKGTPPSMDVITEEQLREALQLIDQVSFSINEYDPRKVIDAVNCLQPLGKRRALVVIREYLRVSSHWDRGRGGIFYILLVLFEIPQETGHMPKMVMGKFLPAAPSDLKEFPRYPLVVVEDIPFCIAWYYQLIGPRPDPSGYLDDFEKSCSLRKCKLVPPKDPLAVVKKLAARGGLPYYSKVAPSEELEGLVRSLERQARRLSEK